MQLEKNLVSIKEIAKQKKNENASFHNFLKEQDSDKIDAIVHRLNDEITPRIDCLECGNCCHSLRPIATKEEMSKFVEDKNIEEFKYLMSFSCKHIEDKKCAVYLDRPEECRLYPYLDRNEFTSRVIGVLQNYEICPIVFNVFERLKIETGWSKE